jgi:hypothetical protein
MALVIFGTILGAMIGGGPGALYGGISCLVIAIYYYLCEKYDA